MEPTERGARLSLVRFDLELVSELIRFEWWVSILTFDDTARYSSELNQVQETKNG